MGVDVIVMSHTTPTFSMVDVNVQDCDLLMATPMLKSNTGNQMVCKKKNHKSIKNASLWITVWHHSAKPRNAKQCFRSIFLSAPHTHERFL